MRSHPAARGGAQDVERAADVDVVEEVGIGGPEAVDGREMEDRRHAGDRAVERGGVADVADEAIDRQAGEVVVVALRLAQRPHLVAVGQQRADDRGADEAGCARDERPSTWLAGEFEDSDTVLTYQR